MYVIFHIKYLALTKVYVYKFAVSQTFMADAASQAGATDSS